MFLKKDKRPNGKTYLTIAKAYRDPVTKKARRKAIKSIGYLEDLYDQFDDPIAHFEKVAKEMTEAENLMNRPIEFSLDPKEILSSDTVNRKNLGFIILSFFYHKLDIDYFWNNRQKTAKCDFNLNHIFQFLVFLRALEPSSKKSSFESLSNYFLPYDFSLHDVYRSLSVFNRYKKDLIQHIHESISMKYGRDLSNVYYDVTNYYFEIPYEDSLRKKGYSKENRNSPIIQMGLLMDSSGLPISYELFEGNRHDSTTYIPSLFELKQNFNIRKIIVVADKGMNSGENMAYNLIKKDGYIFSQSVRGSSKDNKNFVLDEKGYRCIGSDFKIKSRVVPVEIRVTDINGKTKKIQVDQKQVAFYSKKYDEKMKYDRQKTIDKAVKLLKKGIFTPPNSAYKYIKRELVDKNTGKILKKKDFSYIDTKRIEEEQIYDGYYMLVSSELDMSDEDIVEAYKGLWKIEETFKVTKSQLKTRPVYLSREDRIRSHFLICFITLVLLRLLEKELKGEDISIQNAIKEMRNITGTYLDENYYMFDYYSENVEKMAKAIDLDLSKRFMTVSEINNLISCAKKAL